MFTKSISSIESSFSHHLCIEKILVLLSAQLSIFHAQNRPSILSLPPLFEISYRSFFTMNAIVCIVECALFRFFIRFLTHSDFPLMLLFALESIGHSKLLTINPQLLQNRNEFDIVQNPPTTLPISFLLPQLLQNRNESDIVPN